MALVFLTFVVNLGVDLTPSEISKAKTQTQGSTHANLFQMRREY